jgi:hypothetical protein
MIDAAEPLSLVLWGVFFLAAGMYPLGFMLGASCSPCCGGDCGTIFYRCLRQKSVDGSLSDTPSKTIYLLKDAGIIRASSTASATMSVNIQPHGYLSDGESVVYTVPVKGYGESFGLGVECPGVSGSITVRVEGRDFPLRFRDVWLGGVWAGTTFSVSRVAGVIDTDYSDNLSASVSSEIVGVTVASEFGIDVKQFLDGSEVTDAALRGLLTVSQPYFEAWSDVVRVPKINVSLAGNGSLFRYIQSPCIVTWLVRVRRGTTTTHFRVSTEVNPATSPPSVPAGMTQATIQPLPDVADTQIPDDVAPVVTGASVLAKGHSFRGYFANVPVTLSLSGRCTVDVRSFYLGEFTATGNTAPTQLGPRLYANGSANASRPFDKHVFRVEHYVGQYAGEEYDFEKVGQYRRGDISLPVSYGRQTGSGYVTDRYEMQIVEPSPLCGMNLCDMPKDLLPPGVTFTPTAGTKWGCKNAYPLVLGNPNGGCAYSHSSNECYAEGSASISLFDFVRQSLPYLAAYPFYRWSSAFDALSWLELTPGDVVTSSGTYSIAGTYDPAAHRYGRCLPASMPSSWLSAGRGGACHPSETTVTLSSIAPSPPGPLDRDGVDDGVQSSIFQQDPDGRVRIEAARWDGYLPLLEGDWVLPVAAMSQARSLYGGYQNSNGCDMTVYSLLFNFPNGASGGVDYVRTDTNTQGVCSTAYRLCVNYSFPPFLGGGGLYTMTRPSTLFCTDVAEGAASIITIGSRVFASGRSSIPSRTYAITTAVSLSSDLMPQCRSVTFSPTELTVQPNATVTVSPTGEVRPSGPHERCGYSIAGWPHNSIFASQNASETDRTQKFVVVSDGSTPQQITLNVSAGGCSGISTAVDLSSASPNWNEFGMYYTYFPDVRYNLTNAPVSGGCATMPVIVGDASCRWSAAVVPETATWLTLDVSSGSGPGAVKVTVAPSDGVPRGAGVRLSLVSNPAKSFTFQVNQ